MRKPRRELSSSLVMSWTPSSLDSPSVSSLGDPARDSMPSGSTPHGARLLTKPFSMSTSPSREFTSEASATFCCSLTGCQVALLLAARHVSHHGRILAGLVEVRLLANVGAVGGVTERGEASAHKPEGLHEHIAHLVALLGLCPVVLVLRVDQRDIL